VDIEQNSAYGDGVDTINWNQIDCGKNPITCTVLVVGPGPVSDEWRQECHTHGYGICVACDGRGWFPKGNHCLVCGGNGTYSVR